MTVRKLRLRYLLFWVYVKIFGYDWAYRVVVWLCSLVLGETYIPSIYRLNFAVGLKVAVFSWGEPTLRFGFDVTECMNCKRMRGRVSAVLPFSVVEKIGDKSLRIRGVAMTAGMSKNFEA